MEFPRPTIPLFVYGSLRPGMALWPEIRDAVVSASPATVAGRLHWHEGGEWPLLLLAEHGDPSRVLGEVLHLAPGDTVNRVIVDEELRYGYEARWLPASGDDGVREALALVWNRTDAVGPAIPDGDYVAATRSTG